MTSAVVKSRQALAQVLENAPVALSNLQNAYHPETGTLDTRNNAKGLDDPLLLVCSILTGPTQHRQHQAVRLASRSAAPAQAAHPARSLPSGSALQGTPQPSGLVNLRGADPTLGGLLGGSR